MSFYDYNNMSPESAADLYCEECGRVESIMDEIEERTPVCDSCGDKVDLDDGYYELPIKIKGHKHDCIICRNCYDDMEFTDGSDAKDFLGITELEEAI